MKGQISIDYYVSLIIFIFFVVYFLYQMSNLVPAFNSQLEDQRVRSEAYQMSELLVNDAGSPANWNALVPNGTANISRIGLLDQSANETNLVSTAKMAALNSLCASQGQQLVRSLMGTDLEFSVFVVDRTNGTVDVSCTGPDANSTTGQPLRRAVSVTQKRTFAFSDSHFGDMTMQVWKP